MATQMTREQAAAAVADATAERDSIQANLLDLDGSFGKRMLAGGGPDRRVEAALGGGRRRPGRPVGDLQRLRGGGGQGGRANGRERAAHPTGNWRRSPPC